MGLPTSFQRHHTRTFILSLKSSKSHLKTLSDWTVPLNQYHCCSLPKTFYMSWHSVTWIFSSKSCHVLSYPQELSHQGRRSHIDELQVQINRGYRRKEQVLATNSADPQQDNHKLPLLVKVCSKSQSFVCFFSGSWRALQDVISNPLSGHGVGRYLNRETRLYQRHFEAGYKKGVAAAIIK